MPTKPRRPVKKCAVVAQMLLRFFMALEDEDKTFAARSLSTGSSKAGCTKSMMDFGSMFTKL
jgi:hypothetical protein